MGRSKVRDECIFKHIQLIPRDGPRVSSAIRMKQCIASGDQHQSERWMAGELRSPVFVTLRRRHVVALIPYQVRRLGDPEQEIDRGQYNDEYRGGQGYRAAWTKARTSAFSPRERGPCEPVVCRVSGLRNRDSGPGPGGSGAAMMLVHAAARSRPRRVHQAQSEPLARALSAPGDKARASFSSGPVLVRYVAPRILVFLGREPHGSMRTLSGI